MSDKAFLLISIGPIQDFIASARRCQDLWFGSYLLSHLSRRIAQTLKGHSDAITMIFPGNEVLDDKVAVANKIAAVVPGDLVACLGDGAEKCMAAELATLGKVIFDRIESFPLGRYLYRKHAEDQLAAMMECQWVAVPCAATEGAEYKAARSRAEQLLAARKNTRNWDGVGSWAAAVPKSSLDGQRESVIDEKLYDENHHAGKSERSWETVRRVFGIGRAERLCGVGLLKRLGQQLIEEYAEEHAEVEGSTANARHLCFVQRPHFHSTSHMAAAPLFAHFERADVQGAFAEYLAALVHAAGDDPTRLGSFKLKEGPGVHGVEQSSVYDGALLYEGRLEDMLENEFGIDKEGVRKALKAPRKKLRDLLRRIGHEPSPYYALLLADGDRMGVVIDGQTSAARHAELSERLDSFAAGGRSTVQRHGGSLIYSGGDDVLALLPLHRAVPCARKLAEDFSAALDGFTGVFAGQTIVPTLSVGIVMAHHLTHFGEVRAVAKQAEALAKTRRNALAVIVDKRSGGQRQFVGKWDSTPMAVDARLEQWVKLIADGRVSHGFLREIEELGRLAQTGFDSPSPSSPDPQQATQLGDLLADELERIMDRKEPGGASGGLDPTVRVMLRAFVNDTGSNTVAENIQRLGSELYFALELYRVQQLTSVPDGETTV